ncbi:formimidoylglutamase [Anopheles sinensis]|uniref:Formimidoylglutamase n=1 Tax=Anopheles sinensis TaxID=74873 RepID=A0A084W621_ANOSI|nr:formimidoylglutamase [Anopheles sinensis]
MSAKGEREIHSGTTAKLSEPCDAPFTRNSGGVQIRRSPTVSQRVTLTFFWRCETNRKDTPNVVGDMQQQQQQQRTTFLVPWTTRLMFGPPDFDGFSGKQKSVVWCCDWLQGEN